MCNLIDFDSGFLKMIGGYITTFFFRFLIYIFSNGVLKNILFN